MAQERKDIITDDALMAPLIMAENLEVEYEWLLKVSKAGRDTGAALDQSGSAKKLKEEIGKLAKEQADLVKVQADVATSTQKTMVATKAQVTTLNQSRASYGSLRTEEERTSKVGKELLKTIQDQAKGLTDGTKNTTIYNGKIKELKAELKAAKDEMAAIAETLGEDSEQYRVAALKAGELSDKLGDINDAAKVVSGDTSFEKLAAQSGLLGDKLKNLDFKGASTQLKGLTATVKGLTFKEATAGVGSFTKGVGGLAKAVIGHPLFLLVAVVVLLVTGVVALKDKIIPLTKAFEVVGEAIGWVVQQAKDFSDWLGISAFAAEDNAKRVVAAVEKQQKKLNQRYSDEMKLAEAAGETTYNIERSKQRAILGTSEKAIDALKKQAAAGQKLSEDQQKQYDDYVEMAHNAEIEIVAINRRQAKDIEAIRESAAKEVAKQADDRTRLDSQRLQNEIKLQEEIKSTEGKSFEQRIAASVKAEQLRVSLIRRERQGALGKTEEGDTFAKAAIEEKASADILEVRKNAAKEQRQLLIESFNEEAELLKEIADNEKNDWQERIGAQADYMETRISALSLSLQAELITQEEYNKAVLDLEQETTDRIVEITLDRQAKVMEALDAKASTGKNDELAALEAQFGAEEITYKDYLKRKEEIQEEYQDNAMQSTLDFLKEQRDLLKQAGIDTTSIDKEISEVSLDLARDANEKRLEGEEEIQDKLKELRTAGVEGVLSIIDNFNQAEDERREAESEKIQAKLENDLELVGGNEEAKAELRNKAEVAQAKLRKEQAAADRKRALFEKATAAVSIGINTAKGIGMALGTFPPPVSFVLAALVGVLGAIQLGVVLSKPIPSYAKGTKGHKGGWARVGEEGSELIIEPSGKKYLTPDSETYMNLPPQTQVIPHEETMNSIAMKALNGRDSTLGTRQDAESNRRVEKELRNINNTIKNKPTLEINFTREGAEAVFRKAESRIKFLNEFYY